VTPSCLRILIADDSDSDRLILKTLLCRLGHRVQAARDGAEAVELFRREGADLVLLDALMPRMDGMEAAREIKSLAGDRLVPVIFLTSLSDAEDLARCLASGGDDFLTKPYNRIILDAKLKAFDRMRRMHEALAEQHALARERNRQLLDEQTTARRVFDNVAHTGCLDAANIRYHASPLSIFNGDVLFASPRPDGGLLVFLGDFTGHGLPAAMGAMPVAEIFYGMAAKGFSGADVLREINQKLKRILPIGMFCCGAMLEVDFKAGQIGIWNGGLPEGWLFRAGASPRPLPSRHLPLGILPPEQFRADLTAYPASTGDTVLLMTDGVLECQASDGTLFGEAGVRRCLRRRQQGEHPFDVVFQAMADFSHRAREADDLTLFSLDMIDRTGLALRPEPGESSALSGPSEWRCEYEVRGSTLAEFNPLPLLLHICMEVPGLRARSGEVYLLLSELYNNALEHGILRLPSDWKRSPDGFGQYYRERQRRLAEVSDHGIVFRLHHARKPWGGRLRVTCEDTGDGFDHANHPVARDSGPVGDGPRYAGRGLMLLKRLARTVTFHGRGNCVEIVYDWRLPSAPSITDGCPPPAAGGRDD
jgi:CheY-like chemotaxis protein